MKGGAARDIADISQRWSENDPSRSWFNGEPAAVVCVNNPTESILDITEYVRSYIDAYNARENTSRSSAIQAPYSTSASICGEQRHHRVHPRGVVFGVVPQHPLGVLGGFTAIPVSFMGMFLFAGYMG